MHPATAIDRPAPAPVWAIGGPRRLDAAGARRAAAAARELLDHGAALVCGCATGADAAVIRAAACRDAARLRVLSAFGPVSAAPSAAAAAPGAWSGSAVRAVRLAGEAGAAVAPWAGGGPALPLAARLSRRTGAVAAAATAGALVLLHPRSRGALLLARSVARRGLPVVALPVGCAAADLPALDGTGPWAPARPGSMAAALRGWEWLPVQQEIAL